MKAFEHGGRILSLLDKHDNNDWVDFSANINPLGLSEAIRTAVINALPMVIHYPDVEAVTLKRLLGDEYHVPIENIVLGNGAVELIYLLCHLKKPQQVLLPVPSFSEYERAAVAVNAQINYFKLHEAADFVINIDDLLSKLPENDMLFLGNPNNPTGCLLTTLQLERIIQCAEKYNCLVVVDESFLDFIAERELYSARALIGKYDNLMILQSLTKFFAIPGLRLGFAVMNELLADEIVKLKDPWNVNMLAQAAGTAALLDSAYRQNSCEFLVQEKQWLFDRLKSIRTLKVYQPSVNFVLVRIIESELNAAELCDKLYLKQILARNCSNYPGLDDHYVRFAVKSHQENQRLLAALKDILGDNK